PNSRQACVRREARCERFRRRFPGASGIGATGAGKARLLPSRAPSGTEPARQEPRPPEQRCRMAQRVLARNASCPRWGGGLGMVFAAVDAEVVEPETLGETIEPVLLRDFAARVVLRRAAVHRGQLLDGRAARGGVPGAVLFHELLEEVGT